MHIILGVTTMWRNDKDRTFSASSNLRENMLPGHRSRFEATLVAGQREYDACGGLRVKIQLLHFDGCPNVEAARCALRDALAAEQLDVAVEEVDVEDPRTPAWARSWGSPTILIDGTDVAGQRPSTASCCRLYAGGAPSVASIRAALLAASPRHGSDTEPAGSDETVARATSHLNITGMDCQACTGTITNRIEQVPGVASATVDFESGIAVVRHDGRNRVMAAVIAAVEDAGFRAEPQP